MLKLYSLIKSVFLIAISLFVFNSCHLTRLGLYNYGGITDYKIFKERLVKKSDKKFSFYSAEKEKIPKPIDGIPFDKFVEKNNTVAFLLIKNDTIQYEKYYNKYQKESIVNTFSVAKSILSILIGCAIDEGLIQSVNEPITNYIPELKKNGFEKVTIKHLLQMTSGIKFNESYANPLGEASLFYYGQRLKKKMMKMKLEHLPGTKFEYKSGNTQLLGWVLERALKNKTNTQYLQEKLWTPLGMEYDASWSIDQEKEGIERTFCCFNTRARDLAKIGRLYLNKGNWNGKQIVSEKWVQESTKIETTEGSDKGYQYQWWLPTPGKDFLAAGVLGQFVYVNPAKNIIIVRLGKNYGKIEEDAWWKMMVKLAEEY